MSSRIPKTHLAPDLVAYDFDRGILCVERQPVPDRARLLNADRGGRRIHHLSMRWRQSEIRFLDRHVKTQVVRRGFVFRSYMEGIVFLGLAVVSATTAVMAKEASSASTPALAALDAPVSAQPIEMIAGASEMDLVADEAPSLGGAIDPILIEVDESDEIKAPETDAIRYVNGRPVRPVRTVWMTVTAYSPDHRSCGKFADGITASGKSIWTNGMKLVAADKRLFKFGSLMSVPGYDEGRVVPVLDRGGAIKGARLDVLYPTHEIARKWGRQRLPVTIWEYADEAS